MKPLTAIRDPNLLGSLTDTYAVIGEIGRGGMGTVVLARHRTTDYRVAIKIAATDRLDAEAVERFAREARLMTRFSHPNIVRLYGMHEIRPGTIAIVMEYVRGTNLAELLGGPKRLPFNRCRQILRDLGAALAHAHLNGVVHRDVKPHNVLIEDRTGKAMLFDFGIAKASADDRDVTAAGGTVGTPAYMSPEQIDGRPVDHRSDIYALGNVGWELIAGERPWEGEPLYRMLHKQKHEALPSLTILRPDTPNSLLLALEGALDKTPELRWNTVDEMVAQLESDEPTDALLDRRRRVAAQRPQRGASTAEVGGVPGVSVEAATVPVGRASPVAGGKGARTDQAPTLRLVRAEDAAEDDEPIAAPGASTVRETGSPTIDSGLVDRPFAWLRRNARFAVGLCAGGALVLTLTRFLGAPATAPARASRTSLSPAGQGVARVLPPGPTTATVSGPAPAEAPRPAPAVVTPPVRTTSTPPATSASTVQQLAEAARLALYAGDAERAWQVADSAVRIDARAGAAYLVRARARIARNRVREAWTDIELGARSGARWEAFALTVMLTVQATGRSEGLAVLQPELRAALTATPPLDAARAVALAVACIQVGDVAKALTLLERAHPVDAALLRLLDDPLLAPLSAEPRFVALRALASAPDQGPT